MTDDVGGIQAGEGDIIDALPKLKRDAMVLNWVLYADFAAQPGPLERQKKLANEVREWLRAEEEDE